MSAATGLLDDSERAPSNGALKVKAGTTVVLDWLRAQGGA